LNIDQDSLPAKPAGFGQRFSLRNGDLFWWEFRSDPCISSITCGFTITPDLVKRVDFERIECPKCGAKFQPAERERN